MAFGNAMVVQTDVLITGNSVNFVSVAERSMPEFQSGLEPTDDLELSMNSVNSFEKVHSAKYFKELCHCIVLLSLFAPVKQQD